MAVRKREKMCRLARTMPDWTGFAWVLAAWLALGFCAPAPAANAAGPAGSCDARKSVGFCYDYVGSGWTAANAKKDCATAPDGVYSNEPCPRNPVAGRCAYDLGGKKERQILYHFYKDGFSEKQARMSCPGTFIEQ